MSLALGTTVHSVAAALTARIAPALEDGFALETARLGGILLTLTANAIDDAVALRVEENAAMRTLFGSARAMVTETELANRLAAAAASRDPGLRLSQLDAENDRLRRLLIEVHAHLEELDGPAARGKVQEVWRLLATFEAARAPRLQAPVLGSASR